jgi:hypothetical protein
MDESIHLGLEQQMIFAWPDAGTKVCAFCEKRIPATYYPRFGGRGVGLG